MHGTRAQPSLRLDVRVSRMSTGARAMMRTATQPPAPPSAPFHDTTHITLATRNGFMAAYHAAAAGGGNVAAVGGFVLHASLCMTTVATRSMLFYDHIHICYVRCCVFSSTMTKTIIYILYFELRTRPPALRCCCCCSSVCMVHVFCAISRA